MEPGQYRGALGTRCSPGGAVLAVFAALALAGSLLLPWWRMENRAPQYGLRVLLIDVSPFGVTGDTKEIDALGHYVGILPMAEFAPFERAAAPYAILATIAAAAALAWLRPGRVRTVICLVLAAVPLGFVADLWAWQRYAVTHLDPHASLSRIADRVDARVLGSYAVAQFRVDAMFESGFWLACVAAANALGFLFAERSARPRPAGPDGPPRGAAVSAVAAVLLAILGSDARADTLEAGDGARFPTIAAALAASSPGDEIVVRPGVHRERVVLDREVALRGLPGSVIDGGGEGTVVLITAGRSAVRGLTIRGSGESLLAEDACVKLDRADDCAVEGCRIEDGLFGVLTRSARRTRIRGNTIVGKDLPVPRRGDGIRLQDAAGSVVEDNRIDRTRDLAVWQSDDSVVRRNVVTGARYGLHYMYCDDNLFEDNVFESNQTGGAVMYSRRLTLRRNRFSGSRGPSAHGLLLKTADDLLVEDNVFTDNSRGICFDSTPSSRRAYARIRGNVIAGNDVGMSLEPSTAGVVFTENVFAANRLHVEVLGRRAGRDANHWSEGGRGNHWSDYVGFDENGDGIGDAPHRIERFFEDLTGRWPEVGLLRGGPAAEALDAAARAFPILAPEPVLVDDSPLVEPPARGGASKRSPSWGLAAGGAAAAAAALAAAARARRTPAGAGGSA